MVTKYSNKTSNKIFSNLKVKHSIQINNKFYLILSKSLIIKIKFYLLIRHIYNSNFNNLTLNNNKSFNKYRSK